MDNEELAKLQEQIDEYERSTGERSPLRDVLEARKAQNTSLTSLIAPMPDIATAQVEEPESRLSPSTVSEEPAPPLETEEPESVLSPPREEPGLAIPKVPLSVLTPSPGEVLSSLLPKGADPLITPTYEFGKQAIGGTAATIGSLPWGMATALSAALPIPFDPLAPETSGVEGARDITQTLMQHSIGADEKLRALLNIQEPQTLAGKAGAAIGKAPFWWTGIGLGGTVGGSVGQAAIKAGIDWLNAPGENEVKLAPPPAVAPFSFGTAAYAKPGEPTMPLRGEDESLRAWLGRLQKYESDLAAWQAGGLPAVVKPPVPPVTTKFPMPEGLTPTAKRILMTAGGPQEISDADLDAMRNQGVLMLGLVTAPYLWRGGRSLIDTLRGGHTPRMRTVQDAAPGTMAISTPRHWARTMDDVNAGLVALSKDAGVPIDAVKEIEAFHRMQGRAQSRALGNEAVQSGRFDTPTYRFNGGTSIPILAAKETQWTKDYLNLGEMGDSALLKENQTAHQQGLAPPGPPTVGGMTLTDINIARRAIEAAHPEVIPYAAAYRKYRDAVRKFENDGQYRTLLTDNPNATPQSNVHTEHRNLTFLRGSRPDEVPPRLERNLELPLNQMESPVTALEHYVRQAIADKLTHEYKGFAVDTIRKYAPDLFKEISEKQYDANKHWQKNTTIFNRGERTRYYTADPTLTDMLKMDPAHISGGWATLLQATKSMLEFGATRAGAPSFADVSLLRSWQILRLTADGFAGFGRRAPGIVRGLAEIPMMLIPQLAKAFHHGITYGSGQWIPRVFPAAGVDALANRLAREAQESLYYQMKRVGSSGAGVFMDPNQIHTATMTAVNKAMTSGWWARLPGPHKAFWTAWKQILEAKHGAMQQAYVRKNRKPSIPERVVGAVTGKPPVPPSVPTLTVEARRSAGDPRAMGQFYFPAGQNELNAAGQVIKPGTLRPLRFESDSVIHTAAVKFLTKFYGYPMQLGQESAPWFNATLQGAKRIGEAYLDNPIKFVTRLWLYQMAPAAAEYMYSLNLGDDPNGVSYVDHMLNRRSAYNRQMNWYIPIPGRPAEEGIEGPGVHEFNPFRRLTHIAMDQMLRTNRHKMDRTLAQEYHNAMWAFLETAVIPPMPPIINVPLVMAGKQPLQGIYGGEIFGRQQDPFDQTGGLPSSIETMGRTLLAGVGQTLAQMYAAYAQTPTGAMDGLWNAAKAAQRVQVEKSPFLRNYLESVPTLSGNTELSKELFDKQKEIDRLNKFISKWTLGGKYQGPGEINPHLQSVGAQPVINWMSGKPPLSAQSTGLAQPEPTNPLYTYFADQIHARFKKESPLPTKTAAGGGEPYTIIDEKGNPKTVYDEGGIGFKSLWRNYGIVTEKLRRLRNVNEGNNVTWQRELEHNPLGKKELTDAGVDPTNIRQVRNFYERRRFDAARNILYTIRAVEHDMTQQLAKNPELAKKLGWNGKPITLETLDPYSRAGVIGEQQKWIEELSDPTQFIFPELQQEFGG